MFLEIADNLIFVGIRLCQRFHLAVTCAELSLEVVNKLVSFEGLLFLMEQLASKFSYYYILAIKSWSLIKRKLPSHCVLRRWGLVFLLYLNIALVLTGIPNRLIIVVFKTLELDCFDRVRNNTGCMIGMSKQLNVKISFIYWFSRKFYIAFFELNRITYYRR